MALKFHHLSCTSYSLLLIIIFSLSYCLTICQSHSPISSPPVDFLKELNGTHKGGQAKGLNKLKAYLTRLIGYIDSTIPINKNDDLFDDTLEFAIKKYQKFYKLKITGVLDQETLTQMLQPRCGFPDFPTSSGNSNTTGSYYEETGYVWPRGKRLLTVATTEKVRLDAYVPIYTALDKWGNISTFRFDFANSYDDADVKVSFESGDHDDGYPFDGPGGILAHGFLPTDGRLHFDMAEYWSPKGEKDAYDIGTVALHEIGHILGLGHSDDRNALMFPEIKKGQTKEIAQDDIDGLRAIYPRG